MIPDSDKVQNPTKSPRGTVLPSFPIATEKEKGAKVKIIGCWRKETNQNILPFQKPAFNLHFTNSLWQWLQEGYLIHKNIHLFNYNSL